MNAVAKIEPGRSVLVDMSHRYGMEPAPFEATLRATVCKGNVSREEFAAFLVVAKEHRLNPLTKEIYAFPAKGGGIQPIVSIDGWARIINEHPAFDGMTFEDVCGEDGKLAAITCRMHRKDRAHPIEATEYMAECVRGTDVWKQWPRRMLRHKSMIQAARYAFGFSGIVDPDEYERMIDVTPAKPQVRRLHAGFDEEPAGAPDVIEGEFTSSRGETGVSGDPEGSGGASDDEPAPEPSDSPGDFNVEAWATEFARSLDGYTDVDAMRTDWDAHKDALKVQNASLWRSVNLAVAKRAQEIGGGK